MLDGILDIQPIVDRATAVTKYYDSFIDYANYYKLLGYGVHNINGNTLDINEKELHKRLYLMLAAINILEGVRFYVSFACTWSFAESMKVMEKSASILRLICRDENLHLALTSFILRKFKDGSEGDLMWNIALDCEEEVYQMYRDAVDQEKVWADYLFKDGSIIGLNAEILHSYVEFIANKRLKTLGMKGIFSQTSNPLPWTESWISGKSVQVAPQEAEITNYQNLGGIKADVNANSFGDFEL
jgi:ribonucleoside-diphosphate reductase beta chain